MKLIVLGSNSKGNCYLLKGENESLILDLGVAQKHIMNNIGDFSKLVGAVVTHHHGDHSKSMKGMLKKGIPVITHKATADKLGIEDHNLKFIEHQKRKELGGFTILAFETFHDCRGSLGYYIHHDEMGWLLFATDTYMMKYQFKAANHILIECNYQEYMIAQNVINGSIHRARADRTRASHFELDNVCEFIKVNESRHLYNVLLLHLSDSNSNKYEILEEVRGSCKYLEPENVNIAEAGVELNLNLAPF